MRRLGGVALICAGLGIVSCAASGDRQTDPVVTEVDGVLQVELPGRISDAVPEWRVREVYNTTSAGSEIELFRVRAARFLGDGSLTIGNSGTHEILQLGADGGLRRRFGRAGSGPGEFGMIATLDVDRSGNLLVYDPRELRLTRIAPSGEVVETKRLSSGAAVADLHPLAELVDGRLMGLSNLSILRAFRSTGEGRDTVPLVVVDPAGAPLDTVGVWAAREWALYGAPGGMPRTQVGFGRTLAYAGRGGRVALGSTDSLELSVFDATGSLTMRIAGWGSNLEVSPANVERWRSDLLEQRARDPEEIRRWLANAPYRGTYPAFRDLLIDDAGRVWIGGYPQADQPRNWLIIGIDGRLEGQVTVPAGSTLLDAAGDRLALLRRTDLGEEYVVVMEIERELGAE